MRAIPALLIKRVAVALMGRLNNRAPVVLSLSQKQITIGKDEQLDR